MMVLCPSCTDEIATTVAYKRVIHQHADSRTLSHNPTDGRQRVSNDYSLLTAGITCQTDTTGIATYSLSVGKGIFSSRVSTVMLTCNIDAAILSIGLPVCPSVCLSVRPSVCLSRSGIISKRLNISSYLVKIHEIFCLEIIHKIFNGIFLKYLKKNYDVFSGFTLTRLTYFYTSNITFQSFMHTAAP